MKYIKTFESYMNESQNSLTSKDFIIGDRVHIDDEVWLVVKPGVKGDKVFMAPFNREAKDRYISVAIEFDIKWLNVNVSKIETNESAITEGSDPRTWSKAQIDKELRELNMGAKDAGDIDDTMAYDIAFDWVHDNAGVDKAIMKHYRVTDVVGFVADRIV